MARPFTFADTIEVVADTLPDHTALITENRRLTFRELDERELREVLPLCSMVRLERGQHRDGGLFGHLDSS